MDQTHNTAIPWAKNGQRCTQNRWTFALLPLSSVPSSLAEGLRPCRTDRCRDGRNDRDREEPDNGKWSYIRLNDRSLRVCPTADKLDKYQKIIDTHVIKPLPWPCHTPTRFSLQWLIGVYCTVSSVSCFLSLPLSLSSGLPQCVCVGWAVKYVACECGRQGILCPLTVHLKAKRKVALSIQSVNMNTTWQLSRLV